MLKLLYFFISLGSYSFASRVFLPTNPPSVTWRSTTAASSNLKTKCNRLQTSTRGIASYVVDVNDGTSSESLESIFL